MFKVTPDQALVLQMVLSIVLISLILLQQRGSGLSSPFGGDSNVLLSFRTRRGFEKLVFRLTIVVALAFFYVTLILSFI